MSMHERYGKRSLVYSRWHRTECSGLPFECSCIDLDMLEFCKLCRQPLMLCETAIYVGQTYKPTTVLEALAKICQVPAFLIFVANKSATYFDDVDKLDRFIIRKVWPDPTDFATLTLQQWTDRIKKCHEDHWRECTSPKAKVFLSRQGG